MKTQQVPSPEEASDYFGELLQAYLSEREIEYAIVDGDVVLRHLVGNLALETTAYMSEARDLIVRVGFIWTVPMALFPLVRKKLPRYKRKLGNSFDLELNTISQSLSILFVVPRELSSDEATQWLDIAFGKITRIAPFLYEDCHGGRALFGKKNLKLLVAVPQGYA